VLRIYRSIRFHSPRSFLEEDEKWSPI